MITLLVLQGPDKGRRFELPDAPAVLGRESRAIPLVDQTVSRRHAELLPVLGTDGEWQLKDLGSVNGSYINGKRVDNRKPLKLGDQIRIGRTLLVFGALPGVNRASGGDVDLAGDDAMDSAIINTVAGNEDSVVLAVPEPAGAAMANLKILYQLGAALGSSFDVDRVLDVVMDLVFEHVKADRGIILLLDEKTGELTPKVVRTRDETRPRPEARGPRPGRERKRPAIESPLTPNAQRPTPPNGPPDPPPPSPKIHASRTIINFVVKNGDGVLSSNAMTDRRFSKGKSVHNMGIRSALCVPIKARKLNEKGGDQILGVIYIDSSVRNYTYANDQLRLLSAIGLQAGLAVQNSKLYVQGLQAERLAAVGETTAALSHSIKNILQALRGGADVVEMGFKAANIPQATKGWRIVDRNLDKIYSLTMNLLAYSRPREPRRDVVQVKKLVDDCLELVAAGATAKGVMAVSDCEGDVPPVPLDPDGMHQVLMNLLSNAIDAVEPGKGLIRVTCRYHDPANELQVDVHDNGHGIPANMMRHLFELFHSTKGNRGTGLGLAVAKKIVEEHDGAITARSTPAEGTTFTIRVPIYAAPSSDPSQTHGPRR